MKQVLVSESSRKRALNPEKIHRLLDEKTIDINVLTQARKHQSDLIAERKGKTKIGDSAKKKRLEALARDDYKCSLCENTETLEVHHIDNDRKNNDLDNLETLCGKCHRKERHNKSN